jgi:hypothetical protein
MLAFIKKHYMSESISKNIINILVNMGLIVCFYLSGVFDKIGIGFIILFCSVLGAQSLLSFYCILKYGGKGTR